jgi:hypothetical protein
MPKNRPKLVVDTNEVFYELVPIYKHHLTFGMYQLGESELVRRADLLDRLRCMIEEDKFDENKIKNIRGKINEGEPRYLLFDEIDKAYVGVFFLTPQQKESRLHNYTYYVVKLSEKIANENRRKDMLADISTYLEFEKIKNKLQFFFKTWEKYIDMVVDEELEEEELEDSSRRIFFEMKELWSSTL